MRACTRFRARRFVRAVSAQRRATAVRIKCSCSLNTRFGSFKTEWERWRVHRYLRSGDELLRLTGSVYSSGAFLMKSTGPAWEWAAPPSKKSLNKKSVSSLASIPGGNRPEARAALLRIIVQERMPPSLQMTHSKGFVDHRTKVLASLCFAPAFCNSVRHRGDRVFASLQRTQSLRDEVSRPEVVRIEEAHKRKFTDVIKASVASNGHTSICLLSHHHPFKWRV